MKSKTLFIIAGLVAAFIFRKKIAEVVTKVIPKKQEEPKTPLDILLPTETTKPNTGVSSV